MKSHIVPALLGCLLLLLSPFYVTAQDYVAPRDPWGQPDLQGVWNFSSNVPMLRPAEYGERQFLTEEEVAASQNQQLSIGGRRRPARTTTGIEAFYNDTIWMERIRREGAVSTSLIIYPLNGRLPDLVGGIKNLPGGERDVPGERPVRFSVGGIGRDGPEDRGLSERCLVGFNAGPQLMPSVYNNNVQIIQNRGYVVILTEMIHDARIVKLNRDSVLDKNVGLWSGDSLGYWEDDTLVIVTRNFNGLTQSFEGYGTSSNKVLTERLTRVGPNTIDYQFTIEDPATFTDKLMVSLPLTKVEAQLYEYACHEGNYGMGNMLRAARSREATTLSDRVADLFRDR